MNDPDTSGSEALDPVSLRALLRMQRGEITEHAIYRRLAHSLPPGPNREVLERIGDDERRHAQTWARYTGRTLRPDRLKVWLYALIARVFGLTFGLKLMERGEEHAQRAYAAISASLPAIEAIAAIEREEGEHERALLGLLDEERLRYISSIVLGLNDALIELTGAMAGLTLALQRSRLIAMTALITGLAAALSMAASEYLSTKSVRNGKDPFRAALYTGSVYVLTVLVLVLPFVLLDGIPCVSLALTLGIAILIVASFTFYTSIVRDEPFSNRFLEMAGLSIGIAAVSFLIGYLVRTVMRVEV